MKLFTSFLMLIIGLTVNAQIKDPVKWEFSAQKKSSNTYELVITASLEKGWHIYSQNTGKGGPIPTVFAFTKNPLISFVGKTKETGKLETVFDKNFNTTVKYYSNEVVFIQQIKLKADIKTNITGTVEYMVCDDEKCLPPKLKKFDIKIQ